jgi:tRNA dimethylallyltransferase
VIFSTGRRFSDQRRKGESPYHLVIIGLIRPRAELYARLDARIEAMFSAGLLDEVRHLLDRGYSTDLPTMSAIGYREAAAVLGDVMSLEDAKVHIRRMTRVFVRRQSNWFKAEDPEIAWFDAGDVTIDEIEKKIRSSL